MAQIIWGFPGIGKSVVSDGQRMVDVDYHLYQWCGVMAEDLHGGNGGYVRNPEFPQNYIDFVKSADADMVFINCHISLLNHFDDVILIYPDISLKEEYLLRYKNRGDHESFISYMNEEFEGMIKAIEGSRYRKYKVTDHNLFLKEILQKGDLEIMFMTKADIVDLFTKGKELFLSEEYAKVHCDILDGYQFNEIGDFAALAQGFFDGTEKLFNRNVIDELKTDIERAENMIAKELDILEKRGGLTHQELADKIMQGIVNGALGIRYAEIAPYSHGYEVTFGGGGPIGSTQDFSNRWECYCDFFDIGITIAGKIESGIQNNATFGKKCDSLNINELLATIEKRESERIISFTPEVDTDFKRAKNSYTYPYNNDVATVMDVHAGKGLDGIVNHHYHGTYSTCTPVKQNNLVETLVFMNGFCLDCLDHLDMNAPDKVRIINYLRKHGTDISGSEQLKHWIRENPEKCGLEENRKRIARLNSKEMSDEKFDFCGLKPETYQLYIDKGFTEEAIEGYVEDWGMEGVENGYAELQSFGSDVIIEKAFVIEMIGDLERFDGDFEACRQAEKDGVKFINDVDGLEKGCYVDNSWNRDHCLFMLKKHPEYRIENWLDVESEYGKKYVKRFGNPLKEKEDCLDEKIAGAKERVGTESMKNVKREAALEK